MANISKRQLKRKVLEHISEQLLVQIVRHKTKQQARVFTEELLTKTERIMLAKRLMVLIMLERGYPFDSIGRTLKVSPRTIAHLQRERRQGLHSRLLKRYGKRAGSSSILDVIETLLQAGMPPRGKGRWKNVFEAYRPE